jgi:hypothetical protein
MYFYLNDLSMCKIDATLSTEKIVLHFLKIYKSLIDYRFEKLVVHTDFLDTPIINNVTIKEYWNANSRSDIAKRLKSLIKNTIVYNDNEPLEYEIKKLEDVTFYGISSLLLREAYQAHLPAVSFDTNIVFRKPILDIEYNFIEEDKYDSKKDKIINICLSDHIIVHEDYLKNKRIEFITRDATWDASVTPFLVPDVMKNYLDNIKFTQNNEGLNEGQRIAKYLGIGSKIAFMNGWIQDDQISAKNHSDNQIRRVFKSKGKKTMYLSIDIRHGEFELLDENGEHKSVYSFYGEKVIKEVDKATHKLKI